MKSILCIALLTTSISAFGADMVRHPHKAGWSGSLGFDYDGSRHRTAAYDLSSSAEWGSKEFWLNLTMDGYTDWQHDWRTRADGYATLQPGVALFRYKEERLYVNATIDLDVHSQMATQGGDITPGIDLAKGLTEDWWVGGGLSRALATNPDEGNLRGYASLDLWVTYLCGWLPDESDSISLNVWAATNEQPGADNALFLSLEYKFDLTEGLEFGLGLGTDPVSPWDHLGVYGMAGLTWRF